MTIEDNKLFPKLIDNIEGNTLLKALKTAFDKKNDISEVCIATAFFTLAGFFEIADELNNIKSVRLMIGSEVLSKNLFALKPIGETETNFKQKQLKECLNLLEKGLWTERNHIPFNFESEKRIQNFVTALKAGNIAIRRYEKDFLHAKAYIVISEKNKGELIVGSSNMTKAGMSKNLELNTGQYDTQTFIKAKNWFDKLWETAVPFNLAHLFEELLSLKTPFEIFIRVLWELYGKEIDTDKQSEKDFLNLTEFQKHGVIRALRIMKEYKGAIVADEVGLGKTYIAGEIVEIYKNRRQRALLICPASLRDSTWKKFKSEQEIFLECVSYEELARDKQLNKANAQRVSEKLQRKIDEYQLVIIDEAHNYRNPSAPKRAGILRQLLAGKKKDVLLLTATPVNNSLWDFYNLIHFFIKQDAFLANKGILSIKEQFRLAMLENPADLSPDQLFPIIDTTTVKRTRQFIQKYYKGDTIKTPEGKIVKITFPNPKPKTVRYYLDEMFPFENIKKALDPKSDTKILFSRYVPQKYLKQTDKENLTIDVSGLLRSALLKRFESSLFAFSNTLGKMIKQHNIFLSAIDKGQVISTQFLQELSADDETALEDLLQENHNTKSIKYYNIKAFKQDVEKDLAILIKLKKDSDKITKEKDTKLKKMTQELKTIIKEAKIKGDNAISQRNKRKVLIFSYFADTVEWIFQFLKEECQSNPDFAEYKDRIAAITGSDHHKGRFNPGMSRQSAVYGFAPQSMESIDEEDNYDILITTDVLAEGVNLQQCSHIINYDLPWNPMRLVQRHGRIDRIGSQHKEVFLRTIFPTDRLDALLDLEERILDKITLVAKSIGVVSPVEEGIEGRQVFTETREEINQLLKENPALFERGGTVSSAQTGEEYRHTLRQALKQNRDKIINLPWKSGSGMIKGKEQGFFFCATVGEKRTYLRFVKADKSWKILEGAQKIIKEMGTCLRLIENEEHAPSLPSIAQKSVYSFWNIAKKDIFKSWMIETDPLKLQPRIRKINREVASFIRFYKPSEMNEHNIKKALDIVESPWPRRDEELLREQFNQEQDSGIEKSKRLINWIIDTGLEPAGSPELLPLISEEDIKLICWLAITSE